MADMMRLLSLGAGVQSTTLALMAADGTLDPLDGAIFADTGWEPRRVYDHLSKLTKLLATSGVPVHVVRRGDLRASVLNPEGDNHSIPFFVRNPDGSLGMARRECTRNYKVYPIQRKIRELLGANPPTFRSVPRGRIAEQWVGFSADEVGRVGRGADVRYVQLRYPLIEMGMDRKACQRWLTARGWSVEKSACIGCPYHGNRHWREMRDNHPDEWADAVDFDERIRNGAERGRPRAGEAFLHASRVPLALAPIDRTTRGERLSWQGDIFDHIEDGDPDGCSPYGCRSGPALP
jgi:hypothetical protein